MLFLLLVLFFSHGFGNYNVGKEGLALERAAQKLSQDLRRAQEMLSGYFPTGVNAAWSYILMNQAWLQAIFFIHNSNFRCNKLLLSKLNRLYKGNNENIETE
jgi:hypothetical protein